MNQNAELYEAWQGGKFDAATIEALSPIVWYEVNKRKIYYPYDPADLFQEGLLGAWEGFQAYRIICSECGAQFMKMEEFSYHASVKHQFIRSPKYDIKSWVWLWVIDAVAKATRRENAARRRPSVSIISADTSGDEGGDLYNLMGTDDEVIEYIDIIDAIEKVLKEFNETERNIINLMLESKSLADASRLAKLRIPGLQSYTERWISCMIQKIMEKFSFKMRKAVA